MLGKQDTRNSIIWQAEEVFSLLAWQNGGLQVAFRWDPTRPHWQLLDCAERGRWNDS